MTPTHPNQRRKPIKVIGEHQFFAIELADEMLHSRFMVAEIQELFIRMGISEPFMVEMIKLLKQQAFDAKDLNKLRESVLTIAQNFEARLGMIAEKQAYENLACVYFMMDDEPAEFNEQWAEKKKAVWRSAGEADFFTIEAFKRTNALANTSTSDILAVWMAVSERISQLPTLKEQSQGTSKNETI